MDKVVKYKMCKFDHMDSLPDELRKLTVDDDPKDYLREGNTFAQELRECIEFMLDTDDNDGPLAEHFDSVY